MFSAWTAPSAYYLSEHLQIVAKLGCQCGGKIEVFLKREKELWAKSYRNPFMAATVAVDSTVEFWEVKLGTGLY